jgi:phenylalanyl-tRNA synthetase beta chain
MKFSLSWLKTHLDTDAPLSVIAETLSSIGLEVEAIEDRAAGLAPFKIVRVIEAVQHPNADRLRVCRVQTDQGEVGVVCGAPNARTGMMAVFAPPGSVVPGSGMILKIGEIRGVASAGMLVSERELGLGEDHDGIIDLPADAPLGMSYARWAGLDDPIIEIGVTPNRGDGFSVRGVARDLAAAGLGTLRPWSPAPVPGAGESLIVWRNEFPDACPLVVGRTVRGVKNGDSPDWLKRRLTAIGLRPISALVDITNFFTLDLGRPLHVFDAGKVTGGVLTLRRGTDERFAGLHGKDVVAGHEDCVIADARGAQSLAGIVGGEATSCEAATTDVFIECALFDRVRIALTGQRTGIHSDARQRFERGIDPSILPQALDAATAMIMALCGGTPSAIVTAGAEPAWQREAALRFARLDSFGGHAVAPARAAAILQGLGFTPRRQDDDHLVVAVPPWRNDVAVTRSNYTYDPAIYAVSGPVSMLDPGPELSAERAQQAAAGAAAVAAEIDLIEEVLRINGLDQVEPVSLPALSPVPQPTLTARQTRTMRARRVLAARGLDECVTFSFVAQAVAAQFGVVPEQLRVVNPIAADLDQMRPTPLATLVLAAQSNAARGIADVALFEVGPGFADPTPSGQKLIAAGLRLGTTPLSWLDADRPVDLWDAKADLFAVLAELGVPLEALTVAAEAPAHFHPGQSGTVRQGPKTVLGYFGTLHPTVSARFDLPARTVGFELMLDAIADPKRRRKAAPDLSPLQPVRRDFAFVIDATVPAETLIRAVRGAERALITDVTLFDHYEGEHVASGKISLALAVTLQPREQSLTDAEIEAVSNKIIAAVGKATGGVLRGA